MSARVAVIVRRDGFFIRCAEIDDRSARTAGIQDLPSSSRRAQERGVGLSVAVEIRRGWEYRPPDRTGTKSKKNSFDPRARGSRRKQRFEKGVRMFLINGALCSLECVFQ
jgi:hypothetical protein